MQEAVIATMGHYNVQVPVKLVTDYWVRCDITKCIDKGGKILSLGCKRDKMS